MNTPLGYYSDQGPCDMSIQGHGQYDAYGVYNSLSTAYEVFLTFITQRYACLCNSFNILTRGKYCSMNTPSPHTPTTFERFFESVNLLR